MKKIIPLIFIGILFYFNSCNTKKSLDTSLIPTDSATMASAATLIKQVMPFCNSSRVGGDQTRVQGFFGIAGIEIEKNTNED